MNTAIWIIAIGALCITVSLIAGIMVGRAIKFGMGDEN